MTNERKIEILKTENEKLQRQVNELKEKTKYDKDILKYKHEQQKLLEDIRELKVKTENQEKTERILKNNEMVLLAENRILRNTLKEIKLVSESNTYSNDKVALRKINELAKTAIKD